MSSLIKTPIDRLDFDFDFEADMPDDVIFDAGAEVTPPGLSVDTVQIEGLVVKGWLSGGVAGQRYTVCMIAAGESGRVKEQSLTVTVRGCA